MTKPRSLENRPLLASPQRVGQARLLGLGYCARLPRWFCRTRIDRGHLALHTPFCEYLFHRKWVLQGVSKRPVG